MSKKSLYILLLLVHAQMSPFGKIPGIFFPKMTVAVSSKNVMSYMKDKLSKSVLKLQLITPVTPFRGASFENMKNVSLLGKDTVKASLASFVLKVRSLASQGQLERFDAMHSFTIAKKQSIVESLIAFKGRAQCIAQGKPTMSGMEYSTSTTQSAVGTAGLSSWVKAINFCKASTENAGSSFMQHNTQVKATQYNWYSLFGPKFSTGISEATLKAQKSASFWKGSFFGSVTTAAVVSWMQGNQKKQ